jgi:hypothetical protein
MHSDVCRWSVTAHLSRSHSDAHFVELECSVWLPVEHPHLRWVAVVVAVAAAVAVAVAVVGAVAVAVVAAVAVGGRVQAHLWQLIKNALATEFGQRVTVESQRPQTA